LEEFLGGVQELQELQNAEKLYFEGVGQGASGKQRTEFRMRNRNTSESA